MRSNPPARHAPGVWLLHAVFGLVLAAAAPAHAQQDDAMDDGSLTDPRAVELTTADGVLLVGTYFPAEKAGKDTPVVVMLADEDESPAVYDRLALRLQFAERGEGSAPMSVLAVALRGQGDSTRVRTPGGEVIDRRGARLTPADAAAMVTKDMEAVRRFLVEENDAGRLNLNRLAYLGAEMGGLVAANAAALDWAVPDLDRGKQGRDVKALVLLSPPWTQMKLSMLDALRQPGVLRQVAVLVAYGDEDRNAKGSAERLLRQLEKARPAPPAAEGTPPEGAAPTANAASRGVVGAPSPTKLQGTDWLKQAGAEGEKLIVEFLQQRLAAPAYPWSQRRLD